MVHEPAIIDAKHELRPRRQTRAAPPRWPVLLGIASAIVASLILWGMIIAAFRAVGAMFGG